MLRVFVQGLRMYGILKYFNYNLKKKWNKTYFLDENFLLHVFYDF